MNLENFSFEVLKGFVTLDKWFVIYLILSAIDIFSGILKALKVEGFKSRKMRDGLIRLISEITAIVFSGILDFSLNLNILMFAMKSLLSFKQALSIIENLGCLGVEFPPIIIEKIQDLNTNSKKENEAE